MPTSPRRRSRRHARRLVPEILDPAFEERYGVAAFNVVDDVSLQAVIDAATELDSPLIVQTSVKTVKSIGAKVLYEMFRAMAEDAPVPITLHLDHCPEREWATTCLKTGWNSVLFDGSHLDIEENTRQTAEVVEEARGYGADVEGEIESVQGRRGRRGLRRGGRGPPGRGVAEVHRGHRGVRLRARHRNGARALRGQARTSRPSG